MKPIDKVTSYALMTKMIRLSTAIMTFPWWTTRHTVVLATAELLTALQRFTELNFDSVEQEELYGIAGERYTKDNGPITQR